MNVDSNFAELFVERKYIFAVPAHTLRAFHPSPKAKCHPDVLRCKGYQIWAVHHRQSKKEAVNLRAALLVWKRL